MAEEARRLGSHRWAESKRALRREHVADLTSSIPLVVAAMLRSFACPSRRCSNRGRCEHMSQKERAALDHYFRWAWGVE